MQDTEEFSAQLDAGIARHSREVILPVLEGICDGIAKNPRAFPAAIGTIRVAKSDSLGLTVPTFTVIFQIQRDGEPDEFVLMLWIQENDPIDEVMETMK